MTNCSNCKWWKTSVPDMVSTAECIRMPPTAVRESDGSNSVLFPRTHAFDLCGEHTPKTSEGAEK